ncbi:hypothetical protein OAI28_06380 [Methylophilaceae bacterium]|nr:hypothetical protein [Methylophilaceae bacterium]
MLKRLMNVLTIVAIIFTIIAFFDPPFNSEKVYMIALVWAVLILVPNYIIFKKFTIWHKEN